MASDSTGARRGPVITLERPDGSAPTDGDEIGPVASRVPSSGRPPVVASIAALAATALLAVLVALDGPTTLRLPLALVTVLLTPGLAVVGLLGLRRSAARAATTVAVSVAVAVVVSEVLVLTERLTARHASSTVLALSTPFVLAQLLVRDRRARVDAPAVDAVRASLTRLRSRTYRLPLALTATAAVLWIVSAAVVDPRAAGEIGMLTALPPVWWLGLAALATGFLVHLRRGTNPLLAAAQVAGLIAFLYVVMTVAEPYSRIPTSYTHVGLVDYLVRDHRIADYFDARYSWPGSLSTGAMLTQLAGTASSAALVKWALPLFVALWALAVYAVAAAYAPTARVRWLTVWVFLSLNWVGQDYWSSQALNFFFVVTVVAAVATWVPRRILRARMRFLPFEQPAHAFATSSQALGILLLLALITLAVASSHQLSPFTLVGVLTALWLVDRRDIRLLPVFAAIVSLTWISWGADDYWVGHFQRLTQDVGHVTGVVTTGTVDRIADGSIGRRLVLAVRLGLSVAAWATAGIWALRGARRGRSSLLTIGALAVVPLGFVALQSYGGELGLRIFLFSLPFVALLLADALDAFLSHRWSHSTIAAGVLVAISLAVTAGFITARYGNEQFEQTYAEDVAVVQAFADLAPEGSHVFGTNTSNPFRMIAYHEYRPHKYDLLARPEHTPVLEALRSSGAGRGYIIICESSIRESLLRQGAQPGWHLELDRQLRDLGADVLFRQGRAVLYRYDIGEVEPLPESPKPRPPSVTERARWLLGHPSMAVAIVVSALLLLACALHAIGRRWRPGWLEVLCLLLSAGVVALVASRLVIFT